MHFFQVSRLLPFGRRLLTRLGIPVFKPTESIYLADLFQGCLRSRMSKLASGAGAGDASVGDGEADANLMDVLLVEKEERRRMLGGGGEDGE